MIPQSHKIDIVSFHLKPNISHDFFEGILKVSLIDFYFLIEKVVENWVSEELLPAHSIIFMDLQRFSQEVDSIWVKIVFYF